MCACGFTFICVVDFAAVLQQKLTKRNEKEISQSPDGVYKREAERTNERMDDATSKKKIFLIKSACERESGYYILYAGMGFVRASTFR